MQYLATAIKYCNEYKLEEEKVKSIGGLKEMLETMTYDKLIEIQSTRAEQMNKQLRYVPMPLGKAIFMG